MNIAVRQVIRFAAVELNRSTQSFYDSNLNPFPSRISGFASLRPGYGFI